MNPVNRQPEGLDFFFDELPNFDLTPLRGDELLNFDLTLVRSGASADEKTQQVVQESFQALPEITLPPVAEDRDVEERPVKRRKRKHPSKQALAAREYRLKKRREKSDGVRAYSASRGKPRASTARCSIRELTDLPVV